MWISLVTDDKVMRVDLKPGDEPVVRLPYVTDSVIYEYCYTFIIYKQYHSVLQFLKRAIKCGANYYHLVLFARLMIIYEWKDEYIFEYLKELENDSESKSNELFDLKHELINAQSKYEASLKEIMQVKDDFTQAQKKIIRMEAEISQLKKQLDSDK